MPLLNQPFDSLRQQKPRKICQTVSIIPRRRHEPRHREDITLGRRSHSEWKKDAGYNGVIDLTRVFVCLPSRL